MSPYARLEITVILLVGAAAAILTGIYLHWWALAPGLLALALLLFYRDPPREIVVGDDLLLSPADGKIMLVDRAYPAEAGGAPRLRIVIFLSVFNVHMNRTPCAGRVLDVKYNPGKFLNALKAAATTQNENVLVKIDPRPPLPGPIYLRPIAGVLAKRIVCMLRPGDELAAGERFGMIKLGSQTEVIVPETDRWSLEVQPGQAVKAGVTVLARLKPA